eukprot:jgi/Tetstr1/441010/TSEL_029278.t1
MAERPAHEIAQHFAQEGDDMTVPYASATSGESARKEITKILRGFGCSSIGFMDQFDRHTVLLQFEHRGRSVRLEASAQGWASMFLKAQPWTNKRRADHKTYEAMALNQGMVAVNSILRDWVKGQITAVETGVLSFEGVFLPYMVTDNGQRLIDRINAQGLLPAPEEA